MSIVFFAWTGQPMSQRARFWQPSWGTPLNGCARGAPKCTAIGKGRTGRPASPAAAANASTFRSAGCCGVSCGSSAASVLRYHGSSVSAVMAAGQRASSNTSAGACSCTFA